MASIKGLSGGEKKEERTGVSGSKVFDVQSGIRAQGANESDLQSPSVQAKTIKTRNVHRSGKPPKQARSKRTNRFPVKGLALTRSIGDTVTIQTLNGPILVAVSWVGNEKARLVFDAPESVTIVRTELLQRESAA